MEVRIKFSDAEVRELVAAQAEKITPAPKGMRWDVGLSYSGAVSRIPVNSMDEVAF